MKNNIYGYARVSTMKQKVKRQIENIKQVFPDAIIFTEEYSGRTLDRPAWIRLKKQLKAGDTIVFDEVSRMSRNAKEGFELYKELYNVGINIVFLKERYLDTDVYRKAAEKHIDVEVNTGDMAADKLVNAIITALNDFQADLIKQQIEIAFKTSQHEVDYLSQRTKEGIRQAKAAGKQIGRTEGAEIETKKAITAKEIIKKHSKDFKGYLSDADVIKLAGISRNSFYKYKKELKNA